MILDSDHLTLLNIYNKWKENKYSENWCKNSFINFKALKKVREVKK